MLLRFRYISGHFRIPEVKDCKRIFLGLCVFLLSCIVKAQTTSYSQLANEIQFARAINDKWAAEVFLGGTFSETSEESRILKTNIQRYIHVWGHYYYSPRWKFTSSFAYIYNKDVPDIGQYLSPEYRFALQGTYFIHKTGYTLTTRMRGEFRYIMNEEGVFEDKYRYRQMIKFVKPINSKVMRQGVGYFLASEELLFKPKAKTKGINFFDRNRLEIGAGYLLTDDFSVELAYQNEFMPRDNSNEIYNIAAVTLIFNNLTSNLKKRFSSKSAKGEPQD
jgi:hypothetical protein